MNDQLVQAGDDQKRPKISARLSQNQFELIILIRTFSDFFRYAILQTVAQTIENLFWERSPPSCTAISTTAEAIRMYLSEAMSPFSGKLFYCTI